MRRTYEFLGGNIAVGEGYSNSTTLTRPITGKYLIRKEQTPEFDSKDTCYSFVKGDKVVAFIRGYFKTPTMFHIQRIQNATEDRTSGFRYLSRVYRAMEDDLKESDVEKITTSSLAKLAHIAVGRYGFYDIHGKSYEELKNSWKKFIPWKAVSLEKRL
jgi:hypothetical protein